jgi:hypothetical protein
MPMATSTSTLAAAAIHPQFGLRPIGITGAAVPLPLACSCSADTRETNSRNRSSGSLRNAAVTACAASTSARRPGSVAISCSNTARSDGFMLSWTNARIRSLRWISCSSFMVAQVDGMHPWNSFPLRGTG